MANRKGTAFLLRVSEKEAEIIRRGAVRVKAKNLNEFLKQSVLEACGTTIHGAGPGFSDVTFIRRNENYADFSE